MLFPKAIGLSLAALTISGFIFAAPAQADQLVTYTWTTTSEGYGFNIGEPSLATFQVPLSDVLAGMIPYVDILNIQLAYPGLTFDSFTQSSGGFDAAAFVDPVTGNFTYHDADQGLSVEGFAGTDINNAITFLSITIDNRYDPFGTPLTHVADQFNALDNGNADAGWPNAGFWTASFPSVNPPTSSVPEPLTLSLFGTGIAGAVATRRRKAKKD